MNDSIINLSGFYREIGKSNAANFSEYSDFSVVNAGNGFWPQMIFDINFAGNKQIQSEYFLAGIMNDAQPDFAVCDISQFKPENQTVLRKSGIFPVKTWTLMEFNTNDKPITNNAQNWDIRELKRPAEINEFYNLVNTEMMENLKISSDLIKDLSQSTKIKFFGLFINNELASILLSFTEHNISGLYFIATKREYRGKKLAENLIRQVLKILFIQKTNKVALQAVQKAVPLYARVGFKPCGKLTILWKR